MMLMITKIKLKWIKRKVLTSMFFKSKCIYIGSLDSSKDFQQLYSLYVEITISSLNRLVIKLLEKKITWTMMGYLTRIFVEKKGIRLCKMKFLPLTKIWIYYIEFSFFTIPTEAFLTMLIEIWV